MPATAFGLPDLALRRPSDPELGPTMGARPPQPKLQEEGQWPAPSLQLFSDLGPRALQKGGPFSGPLSGPGEGNLKLQGSIRGPPSGPLFFPAFFFPFPSPQLVWLCALTAALAQASGPVVSGAESPADFIAKLKKKFDLVQKTERFARNEQ